MTANFGQAWVLAQKLGRKHRFAEAIKVGKALLEQAKASGLPVELNVRLNQFLGSQYAGLGDVANAASHIEAAFWQPGHKPKSYELNDLIRLYRLSDQTSKIPRALDVVLGPRSERPGQRQFFVFALPKSAGSSICSSIADALGFGHIGSGFESPSMPYYAAALLGPELARRAGNHPLIHQTHAMPWPENLKILRETGQPKFLVNIRDPRAAVLSYYHMTENTNLHRMRMVLSVPDYNNLTRRERFDKVVDLVFPAFITWLTGWTKHVDESEGRGMIVTFERFKADAEGTVREACRFLTGDEKSPTTIHKTHYRKGSNEAPDPLLPEARRAALFEHIPSALSQRFGWSA
jgi:hypothetical protein